MASGLDGEHAADLGRERRLSGRELVAVTLAAVDAGATGGLDGRLDRVAEAGAVGVVEHQEADLRVAVGGDQRAERVALDAVRRSGAEVERRVAAQVDRGVGRGDLGDLVVGEGVDDVQRDAGRGGTDDDGGLAGDQRARRGGRDRHVVRVAGVLDVVARLRAVDAAGGVDVGDGETDARDLRGAEEGERAGERQDAADAEAVGAGLAGRALVVGEGVGRQPRSTRGPRRWGCRWRGVLSPSRRRTPQAAKARLRTAVPAISRTHVAVVDRFTG